MYEQQNEKDVLEYFRAVYDIGMQHPEANSYECMEEALKRTVNVFFDKKEILNEERESIAKMTEEMGPEFIKYWGNGQANAAAQDIAVAIRKRIQSPQPENENLWALHIEGIDDVRAAPSKEEAQLAANKFNDWFLKERLNSLITREFFEYPASHAKAIIWPHSAESHAEDLKNWEAKL